jgi:hypothetical protein
LLLIPEFTRGNDLGGLQRKRTSQSFDHPPEFRQYNDVRRKPLLKSWSARKRPTIAEMYLYLMVNAIGILELVLG